MFEFALEPLIGLAKNIFGSRSNLDTMFNLGTGLESTIYNRQLQNTLFQRDDSAMQRAMADYEKAGINPLMALGGAGAGNTKGFESSGLTVDTLGKKAQETQIDYTRKEKEYLDKQITEFDVQRERNRQLDEAKINRNKFIAKLLGIDSTYIDGVDISDYSAKDLALLRIMNKGDDIIDSGFPTSNDDEQKDFENYRESKTNFSKKSSKEQDSINSSMKESYKGLKKTLKKYGYDDKEIHVKTSDGAYKVLKYDYGKYGVIFYTDDGKKIFYNDTDLWSWMSDKGYKPYVMGK